MCILIMNSVPIAPFFKRELKNPILYVILFLSVISGGSIIYSIEYLNGPFRLDNIYAMFATISELGIVLLAVNILGQEYQSKTINNILVSGYQFSKIILSKLVVFLIFSIIIGLVSYGEVAIYARLFNRSFNELQLVENLVSAYFIYGFFTATFSMLISVVSKSYSKALISIFLIISFMPTIISFFPHTPFFNKLVSLIPFSFMNDRFAFANFNGKEILVMLIWGCICYLLTVFSLNKHGNS